MLDSTRLMICGSPWAKFEKLCVQLCPVLCCAITVSICINKAAPLPIHLAGATWAAKGGGAIEALMMITGLLLDLFLSKA